VLWRKTDNDKRRLTGYADQPWRRRIEQIGAALERHIDELKAKLEQVLRTKDERRKRICNGQGHDRTPLKRESPWRPNNGPSPSSAHFIFANLNGTISAWAQPQTPAAIEVTTPGAVYTGLAINGSQTRLYAADAVPPGRIDVFDSSFGPLSLAAGAFVDPSLPKGLVPFNVQDISGDVYVVYAPAGRPAEISAELGQGAVAIFDEDGNFIKELVAGSRLAAPWGITIAPPGFRRFSNDVLVGNFSFKHSEINAFIPSNGTLHGTIPIDTGGNQPGGLWEIEFGVGGNNGSPDVLTLPTGSMARGTGCSAP
jgi:uncharacterized protein (TIGR03118 family)